MKQKEFCPECKEKLHQGDHKFSDGEYQISYCKKCGFRSERPAPRT